MPDERPVLDYATPQRGRPRFPWVPDSVIDAWPLYLLVVLAFLLHH